MTPTAAGDEARQQTREALRRLAARLETLHDQLAALRDDTLRIEEAIPMAPATTAVEPLAYTTTQAARALGLSRSTVAAMIARNDLPSVKSNGSRLILVEDVQAYLRSRRSTS